MESGPAAPAAIFRIEGVGGGDVFDATSDSIRGSGGRELGFWELLFGGVGGWGLISEEIRADVCVIILLFLS